MMMTATAMILMMMTLLTMTVMMWTMRMKMVWWWWWCCIDDKENNIDEDDDDDDMMIVMMIKWRMVTAVTVWLQGLHCSRCLYTQHCAGCVLPRDCSEISLQPGDHLAVQFLDLSESQVELLPRFTDHSSMKLLRTTEPLTLYDCFRAFTERLAGYCCSAWCDLLELLNPFTVQLLLTKDWIINRE